MEASISKTLKTDWILWHPLNPSVWGECSTCLTLTLFPHLNTFPSLSTHRLGSGNWSLADAVWKEVKHVTSTGSGVKPPRAALRALSPICQVNREDMKEPAKVRRKELGPWITDGSRDALEACDQEHPHWNVTGPRTEHPLCSATGILGCLLHSRTDLPYRVHSRSKSEEIQSPFL